MTMMTISIIAMGLVFVALVFGLLHQAFRDNLLQCAGMAVLLLAILVKIKWALEGGVTFPDMLLNVGLALYALGTANKVVMNYGRTIGWPLVRKLDEWVFERKTASGAFDSKPHHHV
jgi:uncharacterized RDD family membrane protein YckC